MKDPRYNNWPKSWFTIPRVSKPGDRVLVEAFDIPADFTATSIETIAQSQGPADGQHLSAAGATGAVLQRVG